MSIGSFPIVLDGSCAIDLPAVKPTSPGRASATAEPRRAVSPVRGRAVSPTIDRTSSPGAERGEGADALAALRAFVARDGAGLEASVTQDETRGSAARRSEAEDGWIIVDRKDGRPPGQARVGAGRVSS